MFRLDHWCVPCSPKLNTLWMRCPVLGRCLLIWNMLTGLSPLLTSASRWNYICTWGDLALQKIYNLFNLFLRVFLVSLTPSVGALSSPLARAMHALSVLTWKTRFLQNCLCCCWRLHVMVFLCRMPTWTRQDSSGSPHQPTPCWRSSKLWRSTTQREGLKEGWPGASTMMLVSDPESPSSKVQSKPGCVENRDGQTWLQRACAGSPGVSNYIFDNILMTPLTQWLCAGWPYHHLLPLPQSPQLHLWSLLHNSGGKRWHIIFDHSWKLSNISSSGQVIYPGKVTDASCFRIGNIGNLEAGDMATLLIHIQDVLAEMGIPTPVS